MRSLSPALQALFAQTRRPQACDLYTITLASGETLRWHDSDREIETFDGTDWLLGPGISRSRLEWTLSLDVAECEIELQPRETMVNGLSLLAAITRGEFDGATVRIHRAFKRLPGDDLVGIVPYFRGKVGDFGGDDTQLTLIVRSPLDLLDAPFPAGVYQPGCGNRLFDATCGLNPMFYRETGTVGELIASNRAFFQSDREHLQVNQTDWFRLGRVQFITGANAGRSMTVKEYHRSGTFWFARPWPGAIQPGDQFYCWPGCNKTMSMCAGRYNNRGRFRGQPFIPDASTTL